MCRCKRHVKRCIDRVQLLYWVADPCTCRIQRASSRCFEHCRARPGTTTHHVSARQGVYGLTRWFKSQFSVTAYGPASSITPQSLHVAVLFCVILPERKRTTPSYTVYIRYNTICSWLYECKRAIINYGPFCNVFISWPVTRLTTATVQWTSTRTTRHAWLE